MFSTYTSLTPAIRPLTEFTFRSNPLSNIAFPLSGRARWRHPLNLFSTTLWHLMQTLRVRGRRRRAGLAGKVSREEECIRPLASTEASINEQPGNVSIQTHSAPGCRRRPGRGHRRLGDMNNWAPCFKCLNELVPGEVLRDVQERASEWQQKHSKKTKKNSKTCWVTLLVGWRKSYSSFEYSVIRCANTGI